MTNMSDATQLSTSLMPLSLMLLGLTSLMINAERWKWENGTKSFDYCYNRAMDDTTMEK